MDRSYADLLAGNDLLKKENDRKDRIIEKLQKTVEELQKTVEGLTTEVKRLNNKLRKYVNENTPSGAIPPYLKTLEKNVKNLTKRSDEDDKPPMHNARNSRPKHIDRKVCHELEDETCPNCGGRLTKKKSVRKRIIIEMPLPSPETVEHELALYYCKSCGGQVSANVPNTLPKMKFDINTVVFISYLNIALNLPMQGIADLLRDIFHISISKGTVSNTLAILRDYLGDYYSELEKEVKSATVRYKDETSVRKNGETFWMWVASTGKGILYRIDKSRGSRIAKEMGSRRGIDVCDGARMYDKLLTKLQRCWAHVFRRLRKPIYDFGDNESYEEYKKFAYELCVLFSSAKSDKKKLGTSKQLREKYEKRLWQLLESVENKNGRNTVRVTNYVLKYFNDLFTFLEYEGVDPTNNEAERALRHFVVKRKVSQQFRATESIQSYERQLSLFMTSQLKEQSYIENLQDIINEKIGLRR